MATYAATLHPVPEQLNGTINSATSSAEISVGFGRIFALNADQDVMIRFGTTGMSAASATNFRIPANSYVQFDLGTQLSHIRLFNNGSVTANWFIQYLSKV